MPRKLPWLKDNPTKPELQVPERSTKKQRVLSPEPSDDLNPTTLRRKGKTRATRTPSTSPPPQPPKQEFMRAGLAADDAWMMVEDEFLDTARLFTQHLHHAEYHRLKRLAREKNASAAQNISRPVVAPSKMSIESQRKHEARSRAERQVEALRKLDGTAKDMEELDEEAPWARDPHLGGLMSGSQDSSSQLATIAGIKSKTRAAAGYAGAPSNPSPRNISISKPLTAQTSKSSAAAPAEDMRRATIAGDEGDLDRYPSSRTTAKKMSVRQSAGSSTKQATAREPSMPPPKAPRHLGPGGTSLSEQQNSITSQDSRYDISPRMPSTSVEAQRKISAKPTRRKLLTSRFTSFSTFVEPDDTHKTSVEESLKNSHRKGPEKPSRPSTKRNDDQKERKFDSADEIPTFLF